jgi:xanthine dehydrogenase accessory factor
MLAELAAGGMTIMGEMRSRIYGPAGLETGAETSAEIALSIAAEIHAVLQHKSGGHLRDKADTIHDRNETRIKNLAP